MKVQFAVTETPKDSNQFCDTRVTARSVSSPIQKLENLEEQVDNV